MILSFIFLLPSAIAASFLREKNSSDSYAGLFAFMSAEVLPVTVS